MILMILQHSFKCSEYRSKMLRVWRFSLVCIGFRTDSLWANSEDPAQTAPRVTVRSGSTLFAIPSASFILITLCSDIRRIACTNIFRVSEIFRYFMGVRLFRILKGVRILRYFTGVRLLSYFTGVRIFMKVSVFCRYNRRSGYIWSCDSFCPWKCVQSKICYITG